MDVDVQLRETVEASRELVRRQIVERLHVEQLFTSVRVERRECWRAGCRSSARPRRGGEAQNDGGRGDRGENERGDGDADRSAD